MLANTPKPPYYAVIFSTIENKLDEKYHTTAERMVELAKKEEGFLGMESARNDMGVTVSYWKDLESIKSWKENYKHQLAQKMGKSVWYKQYKVRICQVEREYGNEY